jgi:2-dehydro-3-deoxygluconokinase
LRLSLWPLARAQACIRQAVALCDLFLPSLEDMTALTGLTQAQDIIDWSHKHGAAQVVLKLGADGALASDGTQRRSLPGYAVHARDATGAGDCFAGNLLAQLSSGHNAVGRHGLRQRRSRLVGAGHRGSEPFALGAMRCWTC